VATRSEETTATASQKAGRTAQLLALMTKGDDLFNARDFAALDAVHHPDMIAHIPGTRSRFMDGRHTPSRCGSLCRFSRTSRTHSIPDPVRQRRLDHRGHRATGSFTGEMILPNGTRIPPTGKTFDVEFGQTSKWDGEELIVIAAFWDSALLSQQIGMR